MPFLGIGPDPRNGRRRPTARPRFPTFCEMLAAVVSAVGPELLKGPSRSHNASTSPATQTGWSQVPQSRFHNGWPPTCNLHHERPKATINTCPVCGGHVRIEPSRPPGDAPCPHCGTLLWFAAGAIRSLDAKEAVIPSSSKWPCCVVTVQSCGPCCVVTVQSPGARRG